MHAGRKTHPRHSHVAAIYIAPESETGGPAFVYARRVEFAGQNQGAHQSHSAHPLWHWISGRSRNGASFDAYMLGNALTHMLVVSP